MRKFEQAKNLSVEGATKNHDRRMIDLPPAFRNAPEVLQQWVLDALEEHPDLTIDELAELVISNWIEGGGGIEMTPDVRKVVRNWITTHVGR